MESNQLSASDRLMAYKRFNRKEKKFLGLKEGEKKQIVVPESKENVQLNIIRQRSALRHDKKRRGVGSGCGTKDTGEVHKGINLVKPRAIKQTKTVQTAIIGGNTANHVVKQTGWLLQKGRKSIVDQDDDQKSGSHHPRMIKNGSVRKIKQVVRSGSGVVKLLPEQSRLIKDTLPSNQTKTQQKFGTRPMQVIMKRHWLAQISTAIREGNFLSLTEVVIKRMTSHAVMGITKSNPVGWILGLLVTIIVPLMLIGGLFAFAVLGMVGVTGSSYLSSKEMLIAINQSYSTRDLNLQNEISRIKDTHPGFDEYKTNQDGEAGHDPHVLLSFITVLYGKVTDLTDIEEALDKIFTDTHKKEYVESETGGKKVLTLNLITQDLEAYARNTLQSNRNALAQFELLLYNKGGYPDLFKDKENDPSDTDQASYNYETGGTFPSPDPGHVASLNGGYPGQCTWYVYNRFSQLGHPISRSPMGNGGEWNYYAAQYGYPVSHKAKAGTALCFPPGVGWSDPTYGHIAFCERVNEDGSVYLTEMNVKGEFVISDRTISADVAAQCWYIDFGLKVKP